MISVIIVSFNTEDLLKRCLTTLYAVSDHLDIEVIVVDNNSSDGSAAMVASSFPGVVLIKNGVNLGFAAANNQAWKRASGDYILLLNPDAFVTEGAIENAVEFMQTHPGCGICGGRLVKPDGQPDPSARRFPGFFGKLMNISGLHARFPESRFFSGHEFGHINHDKVMKVDWIPGTFTLYRRSMLEQTGLFDERFYIYYEETDLCRTAARYNWQVYYIPTATVIHVGGASSRTHKNKIFDSGGAQVLRFRMRSEWLYFRKNNGLASVLANAGVEMGWHGVRWLVNLLPGRSEADVKRASSLCIIREVLQSLKDTGWGRFSPPVPW